MTFHFISEFKSNGYPSVHLKYQVHCILDNFQKSKIMCVQIKEHALWVQSVKCTLAGLNMPLFYDLIILIDILTHCNGEMNMERYGKHRKMTFTAYLHVLRLVEWNNSYVHFAIVHVWHFWQLCKLYPISLNEIDVITNYIYVISFEYFQLSAIIENIWILFWHERWTRRFRS